MEFGIWGGWQRLSVHRQGPSSVLRVERQPKGFTLESRKRSAAELQRVLPDCLVACSDL